MEVLNKSLTPVRYVDSNPNKSPVKQQANLANCKAKMESLVKDLTSNYDKWKLAQQRGVSFCYAIEAKKTRCLESTDAEASQYPDDMAPICDKLAVITTIFVDIAKNTNEILRQVRAVIKLAGTASDVILFRTWKLQQFVLFTDDLLARYRLESAVKQNVMQNIAHCTKRSQLVAYTTAWEFPDHVDAYVDFVFRLLVEEVKST